MVKSLNDDWMDSGYLAFRATTSDHPKSSLPPARSPIGGSATDTARNNIIYMYS